MLVASWADGLTHCGRILCHSCQGRSPDLTSPLLINLSQFRSWNEGVKEVTIDLWVKSKLYTKERASEPQVFERPGEWGSVKQPNQLTSLQ